MAIASRPAYGGKPAYELPIPAGVMHPTASPHISKAIKARFSQPQG